MRKLRQSICLSATLLSLTKPFDVILYGNLFVEVVKNFRLSSILNYN
jgi:hypothetical protein